MKPILFACLLLTGCSAPEQNSIDGKAHQPRSPLMAKIHIFYASQDGCSFDYSPVDFCDQSHVAAISSALHNDEPNFFNDYVLLSISEHPEFNQSSLVAIDKRTGYAYPVPIDAYISKENKSPLTFSIHDNSVCIDGEILVYRSIQSGKFCFNLDGDRFVGHQTEYMSLNCPAL